MNDQLWLWIGFNAFVLAMLALDLGVFHTAHKLDTLVSLGVVVLILATSVVASLLRPRKLGAFVGPAGPTSLHDLARPTCGSKTP